MVQKLGLETIPHPNSYQVCGLRKSVVIEVSKCCLVSFSIGKSYKDEVWCNVFPMKEYHLLLGRLWFYDRRPIYDGFKHTYSFKVKKKNIILAPLNLVLDTKPSKREEKTFITYGECPQALKKRKRWVCIDEGK